MTIKRPKVTHKAAPRLLKPSTPKTPPEKKSEGKEPAPAPAPAPEPPLNKEDAPTNEEKREIVTSLFMGNPAIPYIPKSNVTRLSEKVFSEEAFSSQDLAPHIVSFDSSLSLTSLIMSVI